jgi:hypothetical protein
VAFLQTGAVRETDAERILGRMDVDETRALSRRYRTGATSIESYLASRTGPLAYMLRLRRIQDEIAEHARRLGEEHDAFRRDAGGDEAAFEARWRATAETWHFHAVNGLIEEHNRWYPAEARLPMDPRTGDFVPVDGRPYWIAPLDAAWVLSLFPPRLAG